MVVLLNLGWGTHHMTRMKVSVALAAPDHGVIVRIPAGRAVDLDAGRTILWIPPFGAGDTKSLALGANYVEPRRR